MLRRWRPKRVNLPTIVTLASIELRPAERHCCRRRGGLANPRENRIRPPRSARGATQVPLRLIRRSMVNPNGVTIGITMHPLGMTPAPGGTRPVDHDVTGPVLQTLETPLDVVMRRYATQGPHSSRGRWLTAHLRSLEAESIEILREVACECHSPVLLYSIGKDSSVLLHLARKAFYPAKPPFPLLHVDTTWKFRDMIAFRDHAAQVLGLELVIYVNRDGLSRGVNPISSGSLLHTQVMKTEALKQALDAHGFDAALGGARRDEEKSRAKERIFSFRSENHVWDPRNQRPELWNLYNAKVRRGESIRVFPISNWTELDVWSYIAAEQIPVVPLYFAGLRPVVHRFGTLVMVDDGRLPLEPGEMPAMKRVRFRTLGCYPLTGAIESSASSASEIIAEMLASAQSERQGRVIDHDEAGSMERKKREGYF
jgi:sulfate adenylyltransferase subunit 2